MEPIRWGILGTGRIAGLFATGLSALPDAELVARLKDSLSKAPLPIDTRVVCGTLADVRPERFDTLLYIDVLEHIEHDRDHGATRPTAGRCLIPATGTAAIISPSHRTGTSSGLNERRRLAARRRAGIWRPGPAGRFHGEAREPTRSPRR